MDIHFVKALLPRANNVMIQKQKQAEFCKEKIGLALCILFSFCATNYGSPLATIRIESGNYARVDTPVSVSLTGLELPRESVLELTEIGAPRSIVIPCQVESSDPPRLRFVLPGHTPKTTTRLFQLGNRTTQPVTEVRTESDLHRLTVSIDDMQVLGYNYATVPPPDGHSARYNRSGFIHPLWSPKGTALTRIHPPDHIHHVGLWGPWTKTEYDGHDIDFWNLIAGQGTVRFARFLNQNHGPVFGGFQTVQEHVWLEAPEGERIVLNETLTVTVWNLGNRNHPEWLMDYTSSYRCATDKPLHLKAYRYGGLGIRGTGLWHNGNSDYLTSEAKTRLDGDATRARWCDVFGETPAGTEGVLFMSHSENRSHPEPVRIWPKSSNNGRGDVFFNFCPVRDGGWTFEPGSDYQLRYRLYGHSGELAASRAEQLWRDFSEPPRITILQPELSTSDQPEYHR